MLNSMIFYQPFWVNYSGWLITGLSFIPIFIVVGLVNLLQTWWLFGFIRSNLLVLGLYFVCWLFLPVTPITYVAMGLGLVLNNYIIYNMV